MSVPAAASTSSSFGCNFRTRQHHGIYSTAGPKPCTSSQAKLLAQPLLQTSRCRQVAVHSQSSKAVQGKPALTWGKGKSTGPSTDPPPEPEEKWGLFDWQLYQEPWVAPWGPGKVAGGLALWFASFVGVGFLVVPLMYKAVGLSIGSLDAEGRAQFTFVNQVVETAVTLLLIRGLTSKQIDESGAEDFFRMDLSQPFSKPRGWAFWGLLGIVLSPFVVGGVATLMSSVGYENSVGGNGTVDGVAAMIDLDVPTYFYLLMVTGVLAPILEETVFRGFLLASLTKFMPTWAAVVASSAAFGLAHLSLRDLPVLSALGVLLGFSYVRSKNLLTPMLIHGAWNSTVLTLLFLLTASGVDVQQLIQEVRNAT